MDTASEHILASSQENSNKSKSTGISGLKYWESPDISLQGSSDDAVKDEASPIPLKISRVSQLDADLLDKELGDILYSKLFQSFTLFKTDIKSRFEPELCALIQIILFRLSVMGSSNATYGSQLQNLKFRNELQVDKILTSKSNKPKNLQLYAYGTIMIGGQYLCSRWQRWATGGDWGNVTSQDTWRGKSYSFVSKFEKYAKLASLLHFLIFLYNGRYRGIAERLLGLRLVNGSSSGTRQLNYEFLNRQLIWDGLTEFLLFIAPLINLERMGKYVRQLGTRLAGGKADDGDYSLEHQKILSNLPSTTCAFCYYQRHLSSASSSFQDPYSEDASNNEDASLDPRIMGSPDCRSQIPYASDCGHTFCYQCLQTTLLTAASPGSPALCPRCSLPITKSTRFILKKNSV